MVSEYFGITCEESQCSDSLTTTDTENLSSEAGVQLVESFSACSVSSVSTNGVSSPSVAASSDSSDVAASKSPSQEQVSATKEKNGDVKDGGSDSSNGVLNESFPKPVVTVNIEPEPNVVQQDFVDMYMKSMQQFTESLAKMKLPMDFESVPTSSGNSSSEQKIQTPKSTNSRVFYGSRAFF